MKKKLERKKKERKVTNLFLEFEENKKMDKYNLTENYIEDIEFSQNGKIYFKLCFILQGIFSLFG